jgi:hypothetical protein
MILLPLHNLIIASNNLHCSWSTCRWTDIQVQELRHGATELVCKFRISETVSMNWQFRSALWHGAIDLTFTFSSETRCQWNNTPCQPWDTVPLKWHPISVVKCGANETVFKLNPETQLKLEFWVGCFLMQFTTCYLAILCHDFSFPYKNICEEFSTQRKNVICI